jgi:hypothetical protein
MIESLADDAGVPSRGAVGDALGFEENDLGSRIELLQEEGGPETGEAAADDRDVGVRRSRERRTRLARRQIGEPEAGGFDGGAPPQRPCSS